MKNLFKSAAVVAATFSLAGVASADLFVVVPGGEMVAYQPGSVLQVGTQIQAVGSGGTVMTQAGAVTLGANTAATVTTSGLITAGGTSLAAAAGTAVGAAGAGAAGAAGAAAAGATIAGIPAVAAIGAAVAVAGGVAIAADDDDEPVSP